MAQQRDGVSFFPLNSSEPSFTVTITAGSSAQLFNLESTTRAFQGPTGRAVRLVESTGADFYAQFGTSLAVAQSSGSMRIKGATREVIPIPAHYQGASTSPWLSILSISTAGTINVTLGYGGF